MSSFAEDLAAAFGYLFPPEVAELKRVSQEACKRFDHPVIVNIGAGAGTSALALREGCPDAILTTVDISPGGPLGGLEGERNAFKDTGLEFPIQILGDSKDVGRDWKAPIHVLFIDGDHSYSGLVGDIEAWCGLVVPGGFILFHDYHSENWPDVCKGVDEFVSKNLDRIEAYDVHATLFSVEIAEGE